MKVKKTTDTQSSESSRKEWNSGNTRDHSRATNQHTVTRRRFLAGVCGLVAGTTAAGNAAGELTPVHDGTPAETNDRVVPEDIEQRIQELVVESLDEHDIAGASVAVFRDGAVTMAEGYGVADRETGARVEATTPFKVGSVSKPVTCTAIARLINRGELDPHAPVSEYIDDSLVSWDESITLAQLATHTAGFEMTNLNTWYDESADVGPLSEHLDPMPAQVRDPGEVGAYSNHGVALAGQVLAAVSGNSFADVMDELLFDPAGMETASFHQPLSEDLYEGHARGHGGDVDGKFGGMGIAPAGALSASAHDMGRFMELHLSDGAIDDEQVLDPETVELSQQQWFTHHDELAGMAFGFVEAYHEDQRVLRHAGGVPRDAFYTEMRLFPDLDFGFFVSYNDDVGVDTVFEVADEITDVVVPASEPDVPAPTGEPTRADELEGHYQDISHGFETHDSFWLKLNAETADVEVADDGVLRIDSGGEEQRWVEREPLLFQNEETGEKIAFGERDGEITYLFRSGNPSAMAFIPLSENVGVHLFVLLISLLGVVSGSFLWSADRNEGESRREWFQSLRSNQQRLAKFAVYNAGIAFGLFILGFLLAMNADWPGVFTEPGLLFRMLFVLSILGAIATVAAVVLTPLVWREGYWRRRTRIHYTVVVLALVGLTSFLWYWNLLLPP